MRTTIGTIYQVLDSLKGSYIVLLDDGFYV
jgi:hypothetical protein